MVPRCMLTLCIDLIFGCLAFIHSECDDSECHECVRLCQANHSKGNTFTLTMSKEGYFSFFNEHQQAYLCKEQSNSVPMVSSQG